LWRNNLKCGAIFSDWATIHICLLILSGYIWLITRKLWNIRIMNRSYIGFGLKRDLTFLRNNIFFISLILCYKEISLITWIFIDGSSIMDGLNNKCATNLSSYSLYVSCFPLTIILHRWILFSPLFSPVKII